jgi:cyclopropane-fatty-acyl-phospholipid synthase
MLRNHRVLEIQSRLAGALRRLAAALARRPPDNALAGSRRHVHEHYDPGNDLFRLLLDEKLLKYSGGYFASTADSLETAQTQKVDRICRWGCGPPIARSGSGAGGVGSPSGR